MALVLEVYPSLVDDLERGMTSACEPKIDAAMCVRDLADLAKRHLPIVLEIDFSKRSETAQFWYVSEEKLEPRLGERYVDEGADLEMPLDIAREIQALAIDLDGARPDEPLRISCYAIRTTAMPSYVYRRWPSIPTAKSGTISSVRFACR